MPPALTPEQRAIIHHDPAAHATVLAVAGSGKTTTMVHRIAWLVRVQAVPHEQIRAVMYNASARADFEAKLREQGLERVKVQTFHAMGWGLLRWAMKRRVIPEATLLTGTRVYRLVRQAIKAARREDEEWSFHKVDADDALEAIGSWKASLVPPEHADHADDPFFAEVYRQFERERIRQGLVTFDDQIYEAVRLLQRDSAILAQLENRIEHFIVDEFQDVNPARLMLVRLLAGSRAKVMVVGDDDQCIYEWQGARSGYIRDAFACHFTHHPHRSYPLTTSFRFGPLIAQVAANVIGHNHERVKKDLIASDPAKDGSIDVEIGPGASSSLASVYIRDLISAGVAYPELVVLVRKYSQAHALQATLLTQEVPFFVEGGSAWDKSPAIKLALAYLDLIRGLDEPVDEALLQSAMSAINAPNRYVKRTVFEARLRRALLRGESLRDVLNQPWDMVRDGLARGAVDRLDELEDMLRRLRCGQPRGRLRHLAADRRQEPGAGEVLLQLLEELNLDEHFHDASSAGADEDSVELIRGLAALLLGAQTPLGGARRFVQELDTRRGKPDDECVRITSVFKAKGLEWDHVLLPGLLEHIHPDLRPFSDAAMDARDDAECIPPTEALESERRLFYVALTRARESVAIFADPEPKRPTSRFLEELALEPTRVAIQGLQGRHFRSLKAAAKDPFLYANIICALERQGEKALAKKLRRMKPAPFQYKGRYETWSSVVFLGGGLPF